MIGREPEIPRVKEVSFFSPHSFTVCFQFSFTFPSFLPLNNDATLSYECQLSVGGEIKDSFFFCSSFALFFCSFHASSAMN